MTSPADSTDVRRANLSLVLRHIAAAGPCARTEIATATGLVHASVTTLVGDLLERGLVEETGAVSSGGRGRPRRLVRLVPGRVWTVAVQVSWLDARLRAADLAGTTVHTDQLPHEGRGGDPETVAAAIARAVEHTAALTDGALLGRIVIAVPGPVIGGVVGAAIGFGWGSTDLAALVRERLPELRCPIEIINDANVAALAEYHALAAKGIDHPDTVVFVRGEGGIGGALLMGGRIHPGSHGMAGEIGHVPVSLDGPPCRCGSRGCLDTRLSFPALAAASGLGPPDPKRGPAGARAELEHRLRAEDPQALAALDDAGHALGAVLLAVASATDAGEAILGGYLADWAPWLTPGIDARLSARRTRIPGVGFTVSTGVLGADSTLEGALRVGRDRILDNPTAVPERSSMARHTSARHL